MAGGTLRVALSAALHVLTGLAQTVCIQALLYSGGGDRSTLLLALPNYIGITLIYFVGARGFRALDALGAWRAGKAGDANRVHTAMYADDSLPPLSPPSRPPPPPQVAPPAAPVVPALPSTSLSSLGMFLPSSSSSPSPQPPSSSSSPALPLTSIVGPLAPTGRLPLLQRLFHPERRKLFLLAINEVAGFVAGITGIAIAGSGLYQVVFSGGAVFTAVLSTLFLRKRLTSWQWVFVASITFGLVITAEQVTSAPVGAKNDAHAADVISGIAFVLVSCLFYSTNYVLAEYFLDQSHPQHEDLEKAAPSSVLPPPSGLDLSLYTGGTCLVVFGVYILLHTVPNWNELVSSSIRRHHGDNTLILEQYMYITICAFLHSLCHYDVIATVGAVPIGVLNAVRAVSVFAVSSILFCDHQASQCYNTRKGISTAIVIFGAVGYSLASASKKHDVGSQGATDRRGRHRGTTSTSSIGKPGNLTRTYSTPYISDPAIASSESWFAFGKRRKEAEV